MEDKEAALLRTLEQALGCKNKNIYLTVQEAERAAQRMKDRFDADQRGYRCVHCDWWHLSTNRRKR